MRTATRKRIAKEPRAAVAVSAPETESVPSAMVSRVVKRGTCSTLNQKGELTYEVGVDSRGEVQLRVVENSGTGSFSGDWVAFRDIQTALDRAPRSEPVSAYVLHPLFRGKSGNCCYFCTAVLKSEGLLQPSDERKKRFDRVDPAAWLAEITGVAEGRTSSATSDYSGKKAAARKAARKPKKGNKSAKT